MIDALVIPTWKIIKKRYKNKLGFKKIKNNVRI